MTVSNRKETPRPLHAAFDRMMCGKPDYGLRRALLEAFMAGAAAYGRVLDEACQSEDPKHIAKVQDELVDEIERRGT